MRTLKKWKIVFWGIVYFLPGCFYASNLPPLAEKKTDNRPIIIENVRLFTGESVGAILEHVHLLIESDKIIRISPTPLTRQNALIVNGEGKTAIPGLIDHHIHIAAPGSPPGFKIMPNDNITERNLSSFLFAGITTVFDMGGPLFQLEALQKKIALENRINPRFFYAGKVLTQKGGHPEPMLREVLPWPVDTFLIHQVAYLLEDKESIAEAIFENLDHGARLTKIMVDQIPLGVPSLQEDFISHIVTISPKKNLVVGAHIGSESDLLTAMHAGVHFLAHAPYRSAVSDSTIAAMKRENVVIIPTLVVFEASADFFQHQLTFTPLAQAILDPVIRKAYATLTEEDLQTDNPQITSWVHDLVIYKDIKYENVRKMKQAGITIIAGSDSPNVATVAGASLHTELRLLVEKCGFTPTEALLAATSVSGKMLEQTTGVKGLGLIKEGGPADIVLLNSDFRQDIRQSSNIHLVISQGKIVERRL